MFQEQKVHGLLPRLVRSTPVPRLPGSPSPAKGPLTETDMDYHPATQRRSMDQASDSQPSSEIPLRMSQSFWISHKLMTALSYSIMAT